MKPGMVVSHEKLTPILDMDEFWTPEWEIHALEERLAPPEFSSVGARQFQALESFDD